MRTLATLLLLARVASADAISKERRIEIVRDPQKSAIVLGLILCLVDEERAEKVAEMKEAKRRTAIGGVIDLGERKDLQDAIADLDLERKKWLDVRRATKRKAIGCKQQPVSGIVARCWNGDGTKCSDAERELTDTANEERYAPSVDE